MNKFVFLVRRFGRDDRGVFAVLFALMAVVLIALGGAVVDYVTLEQTRARAQAAVDAAVLALQPEIYAQGATEQSIMTLARAMILERIGPDVLDARVDQISINKDAGQISLSGSFVIPTAFVRLVGVETLGAQFTAEAMRGTVNLEVSVALDVTGSMDGQDVIDLRASVGGLIDEIVQDIQEPNYSKVALVPYSQAVNGGAYADALRGPVRQPKPITNIGWFDASTQTITGATRSGNVTITSNNHGYANGDSVYIWDVKGMTQINNRVFQISDRTANTFRLVGVATNSVSNYSSGGRVRRCLSINCQMVVTSPGHDYSTNDYLRFSDVGGLTFLNGQTYQAVSRMTNTVNFAVAPPSGTPAYTANTGNMHCTWQSTTDSCTYYRFTSRTGTTNVFAISNCFTERSPNGVSDVAPTVTRLGSNYPASNNPCLSNPIVPLSANRSTLHSAVNALTAAGSTSGSLGILGAWTMLAPDFGYIWPSASRPGPYFDPEVLKVAIIMTDGEFNTVHCNGVVANNSTSGSGNNYDQINCDAPNGDPYVQARRYCDAMKARGIDVYTVGFAITAGSTSANMLNYCASSAAKFYLASNGAQMRAVFKQIARNISALRLAK